MQKEKVLPLLLALLVVLIDAEKENIVFDANDIEETRDALDYIEAEPFHRIEIFIQLQPGVANAVPMKIQQVCITV